MKARLLPEIATVLSLVFVMVAWQIPTWWSTAQVRAQARTGANLRTLTMALNAYGRDHRAYPVAAGCAELQQALVPTYVRSLTQACRDGWGHPVAYNYSREGSTTAPEYVLVSPGRDGVLSRSTRDLFIRPGAPVLQPELAKELSNVGTWYDMDQVWTPRGAVAVAFDGQEERHDYGRAIAWAKWLRYLVVAAWCVWMVIFIRMDFALGN